MAAVPKPAAPTPVIPAPPGAMRERSGVQRWHTPRDPRETPWLGPAGWGDFVRLHVGLLNRHIMAQARLVDQRLDDAPIGAEELPARIARTRMLQAEVRGALADAEALDCLQVLATLAQRSVGLRPSLPQLVATLAMARSNLVQLAPGEGKTLAVSMTGVWFAWSGKPCHVVTANDYLAARDAELMRALYSADGVTVGAITDTIPPEQLGGIYRNDVVYATAKQFLADFLRDDLLLDNARDPVRRRLWHMRSGGTGARQPVMHGLYAAIIDEADGALIDEATTPFIIAEAEEDKAKTMVVIAQARNRVEQLQRDRDYELFLQGGGVVHFTAEGERRIEELSRDFSP